MEEQTTNCSVSNKRQFPGNNEKQNHFKKLYNTVIETALHLYEVNLMGQENRRTKRETIELERSTETQNGIYFIDGLRYMLHDPSINLSYRSLQPRCRIAENTAYYLRLVKCAFDRPFYSA